METLLIFVLAGGLAWIWQRMEALERRVAELEDSTSFPEQVWTAQEVNLPPPEAPTPAQPEHGFEPDVETSLPPDTPPIAESLPRITEDELVSEPSFLERGYRFRPSFDFEEIFGRLLPIWGGGIALAVAGFFLVRWSIEKGMLTQSVRVAMGFGFGTLLLAAAELAFRFEHRVSDARVRQALAGAGLATLYASFYLAGTHYGLIGPAFSFAGLAGVTALAIGLSFRFGLPSAVLGLIGGFAAPALAGSPEPNLPLLATYLALVTAGLTVTGQRQRYSWLGLAALAGGLGWGALMLVTGPVDDAAVLAIGGYLVLIGALLPSLLGSGPLGTIGRLAAGGLAVLQIATLVDRSGYSLLAWGCYLLLGAAIAILGTRFARMREAGAVAAALSVCLLAAWPEAPRAGFAGIAAANALIFGAMPLLYVWRGESRDIDWAQLAAYPVALMAASCLQLDLSLLGSKAMPAALSASGLAVLPAIAAWMGRPSREAEFDPGPFAAVASAAVLTTLAGLLAVPEWSAPLVTAVIAATVFIQMRERPGHLPKALQWGLALAGLILLLATSRGQEIDLLFGEGGGTPHGLETLRWLAAAVPFGLLLPNATAGRGRYLGEALAALLGYGAVAMLVPGLWLPIAITAAFLGLAWRSPDSSGALATLLMLGALWAIAPLAHWSFAGIQALVGEPVLLTDLPSLADTFLQIAPLALSVGGAVLLTRGVLQRYRHIGLAAAASLAVIVLHIAYKQVFAIVDIARFVEAGLAERTVWQALLATAALGAAQLPGRLLASKTARGALVLAALSHFVVFSLVLHNPLWAQQAVGGWPIANLLLLSYGIAIGMLVWLRARYFDDDGQARSACDAAIMVLIALLALSELRQLFAGSILVGPVEPQEDLLRSILAIAVALGFLGLGARSRQRSWRIGSLVLMLLAVFKVFIFDAAGLDGLARIASFLALGVCLIGIGWFYSRQLVVSRGDGGVQADSGE